MKLIEFYQNLSNIMLPSYTKYYEHLTYGITSILVKRKVQ